MESNVFTFSASAAEKPRADGQIGDVIGGDGKERDGAVNAAEEKIIAGVEIGRFVVLTDTEGEQIGFSELDLFGEIGLPGGPAAFVIIEASPTRFGDGNGLPVQPDFRAVLHAVEIHLDDATLPTRGDDKRLAIEARRVVGSVVGGRGISSHFPVPRTSRSCCREPSA